MKVTAAITAIVLLVALAAQASAFMNLSSSDITVGETPKDYSLLVENTSDAKKALDIAFTLPSRHEVLKKPEFVDAKSTEEVKIRIYPEDRLEGTTYTGKVNATLGDETAEKIITINYVREDKCTVEGKATFSENTATDNAQDSQASQFIFQLTNNSFKQKNLKLTGMSGTPQDWKIVQPASGKNEFTLGPYETREFTVGVERQAAFSGEAQFTFRCGTTDFTQKASVSADAKGTNTMTQGLAIITNAMSSGDAGFILDAFLMIIAAVLLIAFIARLVHFANYRNGGN